MQAIVDPLMYKHTTRMSPGIVGPVGDVNMLSRLAQSAPEMPMRFDNEMLQRESYYGSNVQDGDTKSFDSQGGSARVIDKKWTGQRDFKIQHGWKYQDIRAPDRSVEPLNVGNPGYGWYNRLATVYKAHVSGENFLPVPGTYQSEGVPRGGMVPRVVATEMTPSMELTQGMQPPQQLGGVTQSIVAKPPSTGFFTPTENTLPQLMNASSASPVSDIRPFLPSDTSSVLGAINAYLPTTPQSVVAGSSDYSLGTPPRGGINWSRVPGGRSGNGGWWPS